MARGTHRQALFLAGDLQLGVCEQPRMLRFAAEKAPRGESLHLLLLDLSTLPRCLGCSVPLQLAGVRAMLCLVRAAAQMPAACGLGRVTVLALVLRLEAAVWASVDEADAEEHLLLRALLLRRHLHRPALDSRRVRVALLLALCCLPAAQAETEGGQR